MPLNAMTILLYFSIFPIVAGAAESGKTMSLKPGESVIAMDGQWRIGFDGVTGDSRCPKGVQCIWAGDAIARIWIERGADARETHELHTSTGRAGDAGGVSLVRLDPYPVAGQSISKDDYVLTIVLGSGAASASDR